MAERMMITVAGKNLPLTLENETRRGPILNSADTAWAGVPFEVHRVGAAEDAHQAWPVEMDNGLFVVLEGSVEFLLGSTARDLRLLAGEGEAETTGEQPRNVLRMSGNGTAVAVRFTPEWLRRLAAVGGPDDYQVTTPFIPDETVLCLTQAMCREAARNATTGALYAESLSLALLSYVTRNAPPRASSANQRGNLTHEQCQRLREYIAAHLGEELSLVRLAALVGFGPRHFSTLFRQAFSATPHQYVLRQRLREGARLLEQREGDIAEVAVRVGFCSQSHFTAAFRTSYGLTPKRYLLGSRPRDLAASAP